MKLLTQILAILWITYALGAKDIHAQKKTIKPFFVAGKEIKTTETGLKYIVVKEGEGKEAKGAKKVTVHYSGFFENGKVFDSSYIIDEPFRFKLGKGIVIKGWDEGVALMREGSKYRFIVPPNLAYGELGIQGEKGEYIILPNATLIFDVELVKVK